MKTEKTKEQSPVTNINGSNYMTNARGDLVPVGNIKESDIERDEFVREVTQSWIEHSKSLQNFKHSVMGDIMAFAELSAERHSVKIGSKRGHYSLQTFDGEYKLVISVGKTEDVNEKFAISKQIIDELMMEWGETAEPNFVAVLNSMYKINDNGNVNMQRVFDVLQSNVIDPTGRWDKAMMLLKESIIITGSKQYVRLYQRNEQGKFINIPLDIAAL